MDNKHAEKVSDLVKDIVSFVAEQGSRINESKRHWFIILNEGLEGAWQNNSNEVINVARNLRIKCAHVISGAGDISAVGAYCNNEELAKMLTLLELKRGDIRKANVGEAKLFAQNLIR